MNENNYCYACFYWKLTKERENDKIIIRNGIQGVPQAEMYNQKIH